MEAYLEMKEPTPVEMMSVAVHIDDSNKEARVEDSNKEARVETVGALKHRYGDWLLAIGHR
jgi:hypothetical protein